MLEGIKSFFNLRYEDWRKVWFMGTVFFLAGVSEMVNYTSFMALFNSRFGIQYLPVMYLIEAFLLPFEGWLLSVLSQRLSKLRFMITMYVIFLGIGLFNSAVLIFFQMSGNEWIGFYPFLFIASNMIVRQQTLLMWSTAYDLCPTQQAKRIMPVFVLLAIIGGIVAGVITSTLASVLGPGLLYLSASVILLLGLPNFLSSLKQFLIPLTFKEETEAEASSPSSTYYLKHTLRSPFLLTVIGIMTLMPALYVLIEYQYFTEAQAVFTTEAELTSFYGMMVMLLFIAAFLLQLFAAKLMEWLGASNTIFAISFVFLAGFILAALFVQSHFAMAAVSIGYGLMYLLLYYFAEPSYQLYFKMQSIQHRDGFRLTAQGIAASAGILIGSSLSMLHSQAGMSLSGQSAVGIAAAVGLVALAWAGRHLYIKELVQFLKVGSSSMKDFLGEFLESMKHERVRKTLIDQLEHPDETVRRLTIELFQRNPEPAATTALLHCGARGSAELLALALSAVHPSGWKSLDAGKREAYLRNPDPDVRAAAFRKQFAEDDPPGGKQAWMEEALSDISPAVQAEALMVAESIEQMEAGLRLLLQGKDEAAILACEVVGARKLANLYFDVMMCLLNPAPLVKIAAVRAIGKLGGSEAATNLRELLIGADMELRAAIELALMDVGEEALPEMIRFLDSPNGEIWRSTVAIVNALGNEKMIRELVVPSCVAKLRELRANDEFVAQIAALGQDEWTQLARMRLSEVKSALLDTIWTVMIRFGDERSIPQIRHAVEHSDEEIRDHGLEILSEGLGDSKLASALLVFYQQHQRTSASRKASAHSQAESGAVELKAEVSDPWLQAIAIKAGAAKGESVLVDNWEYLSALDKIVFLKQVPLFAEISVEELGRIASIASEKVYEEGSYLIKQGESSVALKVIVEGHVEISGVNEDGIEGTISVLGSKQSIGEAALFDDRPSLVSAQALFDHVRVLEIEGNETVRLVRLYPDIGIGLLRSVGNRLRTMERMMLKLG
ncbi:cyclic nucleotide-binding domain-containing protein [Paenibacillus thalictri]|uniref:Cyclic nucleotide-binding domain-containing protein n=1 Tax=Paenibacillus thalictri TaxID=2527873 RepID=A0A4Q9DY24_9BACL|nr:cyclic nucleotide-binding domain-containing protein [Paenibacillus thalictri]TBL80783.1 cyclic nucleotide-binding domain-containing protein [Paenibacillus thalictri]